MRHTAVVIANNYFQTPNGKVAHGLVRGSDRFRVKAVVDPACHGQDAGLALDGVHRGIPIVATLADALALPGEPVRYAIVGLATHGGRFTPEVRSLILEAVQAALSIVNGLHDYTLDDAGIRAAAERMGVELVDIRRPKPKHELHFWSGAIYGVRAPRIAVLGTDCALGKRTTTRLLVAALNEAGVTAEMIYTGQTGWMQGARYGFVLDSVVNDYVSGELEHAIVSCDREARPEVMLIEGQSALRNPSGPCGSEVLVSAAAGGVILQHAAGREFFEGYEAEGLRIPSIVDEIKLIALYGARTLAITLNSKAVSVRQLAEQKSALIAELGLPVVCPLEDGVGELVPLVRDYIACEQRGEASPARA